jgi:hypothetical protein
MNQGILPEKITILVMQLHNPIHRAFSAQVGAEIGTKESTESSIKISHFNIQNSHTAS